MKVNAVESYRVNNIHFEGKKNKEIQKPAHSSNPMKAIPVAVLIAMSPLNAPKTEAAQLPTQTETSQNVSQTVQHPMHFVESKKFKTENNDIFVGLYKDNKAEDYKIWIDCNTQTFLYDEKTNGFVTEYNDNVYGIEDSFGQRVQTFTFKNIYVKDANKDYQDGAIADKRVCKYISELISKYPTNITEKYHKYIMQIDADGNLIYKQKDNNKFQIAKNNPMKFGSPMREWEIETAKGPYKIRIYNTNNNESNFEAVTIQDIKKNGPELKVKEILATNNHISNKADSIIDLENYQINTFHNKAGNITLINKEVWEFLLKLLGTTQCNNAMGAKEVHSYHTDIKPNGKIDKGIIQ